ncbi:hypothetical protein HRbin30_03084 [bacterium HR30]|nr:hypothetical protein HRbin30_03084 [bacterium HR30]
MGIFPASPLGDRNFSGGHRKLWILHEQAEHVANRLRLDKRHVPLHIQHNLRVALPCYFSYPIRATAMACARQDNLATERTHAFRDAVVVRGDAYIIKFGNGAHPLVHVLDHWLAPD